MKVTPASLKIRRWFVAGVAAVMAIAWTVSSLVTPGTADVGGNSEPGKNVSVGQATNAGGVQPATHYNANKSYSPREDIQLTAKFLGIPITAGEFKVRLRNASGRAIFQGSGVGKTDLTGNNGQKYNAICIDSLGTDPDHKRNRGGYSNDSIENHPRSIPTAGMALMAKKMAYLWGNDVAARNYDNIYSKTGVAKHGNADQYIAAAVYGAHMAFWALDGKVDFDQSEVLTRVGGIGGNEWPAPNVDPKAREIAKKMWEMAKKVKLPASMVGVAGTQPGSSVGSAGFDANGNFVVNYELTGPSSASGKEATLNITTAGNPGLPEGATLVDNATARDLKNGSKVTLPASVTLTLPANAANAYKKVQIQATTTNNQNVGATTRIPIDITGQAGKRVNAYVQGLPQGGKLTYANGQEFINGTAVNVPTRLYAIVPSGSQGTLSVQLSRPSGDDTKAAVAVMEQTRSVDTNGDMYVRIGVSGYSDSGKAVMRVSSLPAGVTLVDQNGRPVTNGAHADLPSTLTLKVPAGTPAGNVTIGAATSSLTGSSLGTVLKPSYDRAQWITIINGPPGGSSSANAEIGVRWSERPNRPEKGNFTLTKAVTAPNGAGDANKDFTFNVTCTDDEGADIPVDPVILRKGQSKTVGDFPVGTKCVVNEDEATATYADGSLVWTDVAYTGGQGAKKNEIIIKSGPSSTGTITATNTYDKPAPKEGVFTVRKVVTGVNEAVNNNYTFNVTCNAGDAIAPFTLANGESKQIGPLPVNTKCTVKENTTKGTAITGLKYTGVTYTGGQGAKKNEVIVKPTSSDQVTITATNNYTKPKQGSFKIYKDYNEGSDYKDADKKFKFNVTCNENGTEKTETLYASKNKPAISKLYAVGTSCEVTEDLTYADNVPGMEFVSSKFLGAISPEVTVSGNSPNQRATFRIKEGEAGIHMTVCNEFKKLKGSFTVEKKIAEGGPSAVNNNFSFTALCDDPATDKELDSETTKTVRAGEKVTFGPYPHGTICKVKENTDSATVPGYTLTSVTYTGGNVSDASTDDAGTDSANNKGVKVKIDAGSTTAVAVVVTNAYERKNGTIKIKKVVAGGPVGVTNVYTFRAVCVDGDKTYDPITVELSDGQVKPIGTFPVGTECRVSELGAGTGIENYAYKGVEITGGNVSGKPDTVRVEQGTREFLVTGTNRYERETGRFKIVKEFAAGSSFSGDDKKAYEFAVKCDQGPVEGSAVKSVSVNKASGWSWTSGEYPVGTSCRVSEKNTAGVKGHSFKGVRITANAGSVKGKVATITVAKGDTPAVVVTAVNDYARPTLHTNASVQGENKLVKGVEAQLVDKLTFTNLEKGKTYTAGGYFIDKATKKAVTGFYTRSFTSADLKGVSEASGLVSGYLELSDAAWKVRPSSHGQAFVAFEYLWEGEVPTPEVPTNPGTDKVVPKPDVEHENPDDPNQTVSSQEKGSFTIEKKLAGNAAGKVAKDAVFPFTVNCGVERVENVSVGKKFVSEDLPVGTKCSVRENDPVAHFEGATFKNVAYTLDGAPVSGKTVTFTIKKGDTPRVAVVATNTYDTPTVTTDAKPKAPAVEAEDVTVVDKVSYTNLIAGKEYTVEGQLHYQNGDTPSATDGGVVKGVTPGKGCAVDGSVVEGKDCQVGQQPDSVSYTFVAPGSEGELVSGYVDLVFSVPAKAVQSKPMVVFEDVYYDGKKVVGHHDINDDKQTVPVKEIVEFPVKKLLAGDGKSMADGTYTFTATCSGARPGEKGESQTLTARVVNGEPAVSVEKVRAHVGDICTVSEVAPAASGKTTSSVKFDAMGIDGAVGGDRLVVKVTEANKDALRVAGFAFEATNTVSVKRAGFSVTKTDVRVEGNVKLPGRYVFDYDCGGQTGSLSVGRGETKAGPLLPVGTSCRVRETGVGVANATLRTSWKVDDAVVAPDAGGAVSFSIGQAGTVVKVAATNDYVEKTGSFLLSKKLTTSVTTRELAGTVFKFAYTCKDGDRVVARSQDPVSVTAGGEPVRVSNIGLGAVCSVEEVDLPATPNASHGLSWMVKGVAQTASRAEFVVDSQTVPVMVVAHNSYTDKKPGFQVVKVVSGDAKARPSQFVFDYDCDGITGSFTVSEAMSFQSGHDAKLKDLAVGSVCKITERAPKNLVRAQWKGVTFERSGNIAGSSWLTDTKTHSATFSVPAGDSALVVKATNSFSQERGKIMVTKRVSANGVEGVPSSFTFALSCVDGSTPVEVADASKTVRSGQSATWDGLPAGVVCTVKELDSTVPPNATHALAWSVDGEPVSGKQVTARVGANTTVSLEARNTYKNNPASFSVEKRSAVVSGTRVEGKPLPTVPGEFTFLYKCGDASEWLKLGPLSAGGKPVKVDGLVAGQQCVLREQADGQSRVTSWQVNGKTLPVGDMVSFTPGAGESIAVVVDNSYPTKPQIKTTLTDNAGNKLIKTVGDNIVLKDVVNYYNLDTTKTYKLSGRLMAWDKTGQVVETGISGESQAFKPDSPNGQQVVNFTVATAKLDEFAKVVAFEKLTINGETIASHEDPGDDNQVVKVYPKIKTSLTGENGKSKTYDRPLSASDSIKLIDRVKYVNLRVGKTYRISGELYGDNGLTGVKAWSQAFTPKAPVDNPSVEFVSGYKDIVFNVPGDVLQNNAKLVAYEELWDEGKLVPPSNPDSPGEPTTPGDGARPPKPINPNTPPEAEHEDPNDPDQTVKRAPAVSTSAEVAGKGEDARVKTIDLQGQPEKTVNVTDHLTYYSFEPGEYVAVARLVNTSQDTLGKGHKAFTVDATSGRVDVPLTVTVTKDHASDGKALSAVVYEKVYRKADVVNGQPVEGAKPVATHEQANDKNQTIKVTTENPPLPPQAPKLKITKALSEEEGTTKLPENTLYGFDFRCEDLDEVVHFTLTAGQEKADGWPEGIAGKRCSVSEVGPVKANYSDKWEVLNTEGVEWTKIEWAPAQDVQEAPTAGTQLPVNRTYTFDMPEGSEEQPEITITATNAFTPIPEPTLKTSAEDMRHNDPVSEHDRSVRQGSDAAIEDTVTFTNLQVGKEYTIKGQVMDATNMDAVKAVSSVTTTHINECGLQVDGANRKAIACKDEGNGVVSLTFTPQGESEGVVNGKAYLQFRIPAEAVKKNVKFVVFEEAFINEGGNSTSVVKHHDPKDPDQTVTTNGCPPVPPTEDNPPTPDLPPDTPVVPPHNPEIPGGPDNCPVIGTQLKIDSGAEKLVRGKDHKMTDVVAYEDFLPETTYTIKGRLHAGNETSVKGVITSAKAGKTCKADGKTAKCIDEGNGFVSVEFTTGKATNKRGFVDGTVDIAFVVPAKAIEHTSKVVAFESAFNTEGKLVAWHHIINAPSQTALVDIPKPEVTPPPTGTTIIPPTFLAKTGVTAFTLLVLGAMALIGGLALVWASRSRKEQ